MAFLRIINGSSTLGTDAVDCYSKENFESISGKLRTEHPRVIDLTGKQITSEVMEYLSLEIKANIEHSKEAKRPPLEIIKLNHNAIDDNGLISILNNVFPGSKLKSLEVANNQITDLGACHIAQGLSKAADLNYINLANNKLTVTGAEKLILKALDLRKEICFDFNGNNLSQQDFVKLMQLCKETQVTFQYIVPVSSTRVGTIGSPMGDPPFILAGSINSLRSSYAGSPPDDGAPVTPIPFSNTSSSSSVDSSGIAITPTNLAFGDIDLNLDGLATAFASPATMRKGSAKDENASQGAEISKKTEAVAIVDQHLRTEELRVATETKAQPLNTHPETRALDVDEKENVSNVVFDKMPNDRSSVESKLPDTKSVTTVTDSNNNTAHMLKTLVGTTKMAFLLSREKEIFEVNFGHSACLQIDGEVGGGIYGFDKVDPAGHKTDLEDDNKEGFEDVATDFARADNKVKGTGSCENTNQLAGDVHSNKDDDLSDDEEYAYAKRFVIT